MSSQHSFEAVLNRFKNGVTLVNAWPDYAPGNALLVKAALTAHVAAIETANTDVTTAEETLGTARATRLPLVFQIKDTNPACLQLRISGIVNYLRSDPDNPAFLTAAKKVDAIRKKMRPVYPKKAEGAPRGAGKSAMEKSFASAVGHGRAVIAIVTALGVAYSPADNNLKVAQLTTLVTQIEAANEAVQIAQENYGVKNKIRFNLYKAATGLEKRRTGILNYLASFPGLKKSTYYREFNQAIKGT